MTDAGRVLVVDDDFPVREVLSEYLVARGYTVVTAADGWEALDAFARERADVVLLDLRMPGMDGLQVLKRLREADPDVAVIMVTANDDVSLARETLSLGAFDYVAKPFDFEHLNETVMTAVFHSARIPRGDGTPSSTAQVWSRVSADVFRVARGMSPEARGSTGARLEDAVLAAARRALAGDLVEAVAHLDEIEVLVNVANELGDLPAAGRSTIDAALKTARATLPPR